jgi:sialidase-1
MHIHRYIIVIVLHLVFASTDHLAAQPGDTTWFVRDGAAVDIVDEHTAWFAGDGGLSATGVRNRLDAGRCVGAGDFLITAELKLDDVTTDDASLMIDAGGPEAGELIFARGGKLVARAFFFGDRTQVVRPIDGLIESDQWFTLKVQRAGDVVTFTIDDEPVWTMQYGNERPFGKITLKPGKGTMTVRSFGVRGETTPLSEWVPILERDHEIVGDLHTDVFVSGHDGYHTYRIPAIVTANSGMLLAFAEGRKNSGADHGDVDMVLRRSEDGGRTWLPMQLVYEEGGTERITIGNPSPVVDRETGRVWLFFCRDNKRVLVTHSNDDGVTWAEPIDLTDTLKLDGWREWYATGPCHGIQLQSGRLVIPANHGMRGGSQTHMILSDDHGQTWRVGGSAMVGTNETSIAELPGNRVYSNMRISGHKNGMPYCRRVAVSDDGGETFGPTEFDHDLIGSICEASVLSFQHNGKHLLLISNPKSQRRERMTVRASTDEGKTWTDGLRIYEGSSAYSDLVQVDDQTIGLLFERDLYAKLTFVRITPQDVLDAVNP